MVESEKRSGSLAQSLVDDVPVVLAAAASAAAALGAQTIPRWSVLCLAGLGCITLSGASVAGSTFKGAATVGESVRIRRLFPVIAWICIVVATVGFRAQQDLAGLEEQLPTQLDGVAELGSDPVTGPFGSSAELVVGGRRWYAVADRDAEALLLDARAGERLRVSGSVSSIDGAPEGWVRARHLAGRLRLTGVERLDAGHPWFVVANGVHELLERGAGSMEGQHRALYLGLVVGDDRGQDELTEFRFRASGLTHLLAVSGQNLVFVLVALGPLLRRLPFRTRWFLGVVAVGGFMLVTRAEPSVLRAGVMAVLALTASAVGRPVPGLRVVALAVCVLLVGDPMLVHSVGFRLSVAATTGLVLLARPIATQLPGPGFLTAPLAVTMAAQVGAIPVMAVTFGPASVLTVPANLLAEPAAGLVMTLGMSTGLLAGLVREEVAWVLQAPVRLAVWWIDSVAASMASLAAPPLGLVGWMVFALGVVACVWVLRRSNGAAPGTAMVLLVVPMLVLLRPPTPDHQLVDLGHGAVLRGDCGRWEILLEPGDEAGSLIQERTAEVVEALWSNGVTRVASVSGGGAVALAGQLGATVEYRTAEFRALASASTPEAAARGSPCL